MSHPLAGSTVVLEFPELPAHLQALMDEDPERRPCASLYLPADHAGGPLPLLIWLQGAGGGDGRDCTAGRRLVAERPCAVCTLPLFKQHLPSPDGDPDQWWTRLRLEQADVAVLQACWRDMLARIDRLLPERDRSRSWIGGFSNGAHAIALLLESRDPDLTDWADHVLLVEGGDQLRAAHRIRGRLLIVQGGNRTTNQDFLRPAVEAAEAAGADCSLIDMPEVGHDFPPEWQRLVAERMGLGR